MTEKLLAFYGRLEATRWICIALKPCRETEHGVKEFYANLSMVYLSNPMIIIRGKEVCFRDEWINKVYGLQNIDMRDYKANDYSPRS